MNKDLNKILHKLPRLYWINGIAGQITKYVASIVIKAKLEELENNKWHPNEATWIAMEANRVEKLNKQIEGLE